MPDHRRTSPAEIRRALDVLIGLPLRCVDRATNMLMLDFGQYYSVRGLGGWPRTVPGWTLHVQSVWRISLRARIMLAYRDLYYPADPALSDDETWDYDSRPGTSRFDVGAEQLSAHFARRRPQVQSVAVDEVGGFALLLSRGYRVDVFPDNSSSDEWDEHWRLFRPGVDQAHFVLSNRTMRDAATFRGS